MNLESSLLISKKVLQDQSQHIIKIEKMSEARLDSNYTLFYIRNSKTEVQAGCSEPFPNFEVEVFLICS